MSVLSQIMRPSQGAAWITGASGGIGRALALKLAKKGWTVYVTARSEDALQKLADEAADGRIKLAPGDVTDPMQMTDIVARIKSETPLALVILNAGIYTPMRAVDFSADTARKMFRVNLEGVTNALDPVIKVMRDQGTGHIALTASVAGYRGLPDSAAYSATKAGLIAMGEALAMDGEDLGIRFSVICPGFVDTEATSVNGFDMPFLMQPDEAAQRIVDGLEKPGFEIAFPTRFVVILRAIGLLPNRAYIWLMRKALSWDGSNANR